jgi:hypothetical protein
MEKIRRVKIGTHVSRIESSRKAASVRWSKHKSNYAPAMRSDANREQRTITEKKEDSPPTPSHALPDYDPTDLVAWLVQEYPQHRQRGPWQYALADLIDQDHAANRPAGYSEALIRAGLPRFQRSQQWRDGKVENLERWLREKLFIHPPPEHEGEHSKPSPPPETVDEYMARKARERGQTT